MVSLLGSLQSIPAPWHYAAAFVGVTACVPRVAKQLHGGPADTAVTQRRRCVWHRCRLTACSALGLHAQVHTESVSAGICQCQMKMDLELLRGSGRRMGRS